jgi:alpha-1,2-mannosyltransferase
MHWDEWIELDNEYLQYHSLKAARIAERGEKCCKTAPEAWDAAVELLEELCGYLPERYPSLYQRLEGRRNGVVNLATGETIDIKTGLEVDKEDPMQVCARLVQDDLAIMVEVRGPIYASHLVPSVHNANLPPQRPDGQYHLLAGAILLAGFWRLEDKFGMPLSEIHTSGDVPQYKEKLEKGMLNMFKRLKPEKPVLRNNYFIQVDGNLAWSESLGGEDDEGISWASAGKVEGIENVHFRSERQSLRRCVKIDIKFRGLLFKLLTLSRLPRSGGIVFTIRTYFHRITDICQEPYVPGRLASAMRSWGDDVSHYKGKAQYADVLLGYLDAMHRKQIEVGLDLEKEDEVRAYPY